ncbi:coiled-coil domain-containing protein 57 isoform X2 [Canis lupus baileyi]|uniref:coiled-coil domain-containing protein 57 isoform X2 n=1 Tax=Canis lupus dingo TaxID=286419 RepID=UPI000BA9FC94|nr:coiled-coil domain-containing protein 57 isoform X2 [Canis lupus dingo]XP_038478909.1 coiled-coil domain-containing protein 57 isoform X2 [Canis lupus familiaris]XP_038531301.1 coiled-coil domain-containing protein 57 isoform X2 [Canis lupus familiaris]|eukprot:XP_022278319.1 coiled-coil domain-containing protein 57 isoform X1 [Canis lupus familiaris]
MLPPPSPSEAALSQLLARKEEEWRALQAHRCQLQEAALQAAHSQLQEAQGALRCLQEDFAYNLQVLEERDLELERYDAAFAEARGREEARQAELSELRVQVARLRQALAGEAQRREDLQQQLQLKLQEHRLELERIHSDKNSEMDQQREQYENLKWQLQRKLEELEGELALQRQELQLEFESEMQKREHGFRLQADGMSNAVLTQELKVKLLNKELGALKEAAAQAAESLRGAEAANAGLEEQLQHSHQELRDLAASKDARIKDLEGKLNSVQLSRKKEEEVFRRKHEELDHLARERDVALVAVKEAHAEQLRALEARALELQARCETLELQLRRAEWRRADALKEKDAAVDQLREDASTLRSGWDAQVAQLSKDIISRDLQIQSLQEEAGELKAHLARCQQDVGRYKQQLSAAADRERCLERERAQLELDWRQRCDSVERDHYRKSEDLIQALTEARDQAAAKLQETERTLRDQEVVLQALSLERDWAVEALRTRGLLPDKEVQVLLRHREEETKESFPSYEIQRLQEQNTSLRRAVSEMRKEMETLSEHVLPPAPSGSQAGGPEEPRPHPEAAAKAPDHVMVLETEIRNLKDKLKTLEEQIEDVLDPAKRSSSYADVQPSVHCPAEAPGGAMSAGHAPVGQALRRLRDRTHLTTVLVARLKQKVPADQGPPRTEDLSVPRLQRRLKEATRKILRLCEEKEQLLEMGNRLRAALARAPNNLPRKLPRHPLPTLEAPLGQLQPHFAAQDSEHLREERVPARPGDVQPGVAQTVGSSHPPPGCAAGAAEPGQRQHRSTRQKENRSPRPRPAPGPHKESGHHTRSSSTPASSPLQDTWKLLDLGSSPSGLTSQDDSEPGPATSSLGHPDPSSVGTQAAFAITGVKMEAQAKAKPTGPSRAHPARTKGCPRPPRPPKIRNYNLKD